MKIVRGIDEHRAWRAAPSGQGTSSPAEAELHTTYASERQGAECSPIPCLVQVSSSAAAVQATPSVSPRTSSAAQGSGSGELSSNTSAIANTLATSLNVVSILSLLHCCCTVSRCDRLTNAVVGPRRHVNPRRHTDVHTITVLHALCLRAKSLCASS